MSARTPFLPFVGQLTPTISSNLTSDGSALILNPEDALRRGSGQASSNTENIPLSLGVNQRLPLAGLLGRRLIRSTSHKNLFQVAAVAVSLNRPQTVAGYHSDSAGNRFKQSGMALNNTNNITFSTASPSFERIVCLVPIEISQPWPGILTSPTPGSFNPPVLPSQVNPTSPDQPMDCDEAHILNDSRPHRRSTSGALIPQQPSLDPFHQSGSSDEHIHTIELSGSFRTSTPSERSLGRGASAIRARRVFPQDCIGHDYQSGYYDTPSLSSNTRRPRGHHLDEGDQPQPSLKRQRSSLGPPVRGVTFFPPCCTVPPTDLIKNVRHAPDEQNSQQQDHGHPEADPPAHQCILGQMLSFDVDGLLQNQVDHAHNRAQFWATASNKEWEDGAEGERYALSQDFH